MDVPTYSLAERDRPALGAGPRADGAEEVEALIWSTREETTIGPGHVHQRCQSLGLRRRRPDGTRAIS